MSVALFQFDRKDIYDRDAEIILSAPISTEAFYLEYWEKAIKELDIKIFQDGSEFDKTKLDEVLLELKLLKDWTIKNLSGYNLEYMKERIENMQKIIPEVFIDDTAVLYIF